MIVDADCHISAAPVGFEIGVDELLKRMDGAGIDQAVCWPMLTYTREVAADNRAIYRGSQSYPSRIIPFGGINPRLGLSAAKSELERCIAEYGVRGVKLNGARDQYAIDDPQLAMPLIERIASAGLVLALHCGANDYERTHPLRVARISDLFPELKILLVHMGGAGMPGLYDTVIELAERYPNWYLIDSEADYRKVLQALRQLGADRVCFGSDSPFTPLRYEWGIRQVVYQDLSPSEKALVCGGNISRVLGL
ncbi:MAG: amidohydrolase [Chloroflexi bacterium]|nr:amidohydrolase [Chloroflexota bacterium]